MLKVFKFLILISLALSACLPEGVRLPQSPYLKKLEPKSGLLAYLSPDGNIHTIDQAGDNQHALTTDAKAGGRAYGFPIWSPANRQVAFVYNSLEDNQVKNAGIIVVGPDVDQSSEVFNSEKEFPLVLSWSPNGKQLSFSTTDGSSRLENLRAVSPSGGESAFLDLGSLLFWVWSPDSRQLLLHAGGSARSDPEAHLTLLNFGEKLEKTRWELPPADFQSPDWVIGDHGIIIAGENAEGKDSLLLLNPQGNNPGVVADLEGKVSFAWSPDGTRIAYLAAGMDENGTALPQLVVIHPDHPQEKITVAQPGISTFFWSPDSKRIAYLASVTSTPEIGTGTAASGVGQKLDLRVLDISTGSSRSFTTFIPTEQFAGALEDFGSYQRSSTIWSPDSQNLVISAVDSQGNPGIFIVDGSGSLEPRYLVSGLLAFWSWK